jgi:hypothetical protein
VTQGAVVCVLPRELSLVIIRVAISTFGESKKEPPRECLLLKRLFVALLTEQGTVLSSQRVPRQTVVKCSRGRRGPCRRRVACLALTVPERSPMGR